MSPWRRRIAIQRRLAPLAQAAAPIALADVRLVAGVDVSYADRARGAVVVYRYPQMELVEQATATLDVAFPYVPAEVYPALSSIFR